MWNLKFKKLRVGQGQLAYQFGPLFLNIERTYEGFGVSVLPVLYARLGFSQKRYFLPALFILISLGVCTVSFRLARPFETFHRGQRKYQVKKYEKNEHFDFKVLPGFMKWEVKEVLGWSDIQALIQVSAGDGQNYIIPANCLSIELFTEALVGTLKNPPPSQIPATS